MYAPEQLNELMAASDYVVMATPHTPATDQMVGAAAFAAMKPTGEPAGARLMRSRGPCQSPMGGRGLWR